MYARGGARQVLVYGEDDAVPRYGCCKALSGLALPDYNTGLGVEGVHARLLGEHQIARVAGIASEEVAKGCRAEKAVVAKCRSAIEASATAYEDNVGRPDSRTMGVLGVEIEQIEGAIFPADGRVVLIGEVGRSAEIEVTGPSGALCEIWLAKSVSAAATPDGGKGP